MGSIAVLVRNAMLNAMARGTAYANSELWVQLHLGDPGAAGTLLPAVNTTRMRATFGVAASAGAIANTVDVVWPSVPATETYTHISLWSDETSGTVQGTDQLAAPAPVTATDPFTISAGDLVLTVL